MKRNVMVSIEDFVHDRAITKGLNISSVCEDALRERLECFNKSILPEDCHHEWTWPFSVPSGLAKQCKVCGIFKRVVLETHKKTFEKINSSNP